MPKARDIRDFFRPVQQPKKKRPSDDDIWDTIIVDSTKKRQWQAPQRKSGRILSQGASRYSSPLPAVSKSPLPEPQAQTNQAVSSFTSLSQLSQTSTTSTSRRIVENDGVLAVPDSENDEDESDSVESHPAHQMSIETSCMLLKSPPQQPSEAESSLDMPYGESPSKKIAIRQKSSRPSRLRQGSKNKFLWENSSLIEEEDDIIGNHVTSIRRQRVRATSDQAVQKPSNETSKSRHWPTRNSKPRFMAKKDRSLAPSLPASPYQFSLSTLVDITKKHSMGEAKIAKAKAKLDALARDNQPQNTPVDEKMLASVLGDENNNGQAKRLFQAMQRTDALQQETVWYFFGKENKITRKGFPENTVAHSGWGGLLLDQRTRKHALISGFVSTMVYHNPLPDELLEWFLDELSYEAEDALAWAYISILKSSGKKITRILDPQKLSQLFEHLGAKPEALNTNLEVQPRHQLFQNGSNSTQPLPPGLKWIVIALTRLASFLQQPTKSRAIGYILWLYIDSTVAEDGNIQTLSKEAFAALVESLPDETVNEILSDVGRNIVAILDSPMLRFRLTSSIPCHTPRLTDFKRHIALAFFDSSDIFLTPLTSAILPSSIIQRFKTAPLFDISENTNYEELYATISLLDIAIEAGFSSFNFLGQNTTEALQEEQDFNARIDELVKEVRWINSRIIYDAMKDISRSYAKEACDRLAERLENAVRTKKLTLPGIFENREQTPSLMGKWFSKTKASEQRDHITAA